jgi:hypothetical protein
LWNRIKIAGIELAIEMHKSGKTIRWIRKKMTNILLDENDNPLKASFISSQFAAFGYDYKKTEKGMKWTKLHRKPDIKLDNELDRRYQTLERHFLEKWKEDDTPETAAQKDGFPKGWSKQRDEEYIDIFIDRYKKGLVTVWKREEIFGGGDLQMGLKLIRLSPSTKPLMQLNSG